MGKGDIKTTKGKRTRGSYGNTRKRKKTVKIVAAKPKKKTAPKKTSEETRQLKKQHLKLKKKKSLNDIYKLKKSKLRFGFFSLSFIHLIH